MRVVQLRSFALAAAAVTAALAMAPPASPTPSSKALTLLADIVHNRDEAVIAQCNSQMRAALTASKLKGAWGTYQLVFGDYISHGTPASVSRAPVTVVRVPLHMARMPGEFRVTFQADGRVAGLYFLRTGIPVP